MTGNFDFASFVFKASTDLEDAILLTGYAFQKRDGQVQDKALLLQKYQKGAEEGIAHDQFWLGILYAKGVLVPQDQAKAHQWLTSSAEQGHALAQRFLAILLYRQETKDYAEIYKWLKMSAEQGLAIAQKELGDILFLKDNPHRNEKESFEWHLQAARRGHGNAQYAVSRVYMVGTSGVEKNILQSCFWTSIALFSFGWSKEAGLADAKLMLKPEEFEELQKMLLEWQPEKDIYNVVNALNKISYTALNQLAKDCLPPPIPQ